MTPLPWRRVVLGGTVAFAAGTAAVAGSYAVVGGSTAFVAATIANTMVTLTPAAIVTFAITVLGDIGSDLAYLSGLAATVVALGAVAGGARLVAARRGRRTVSPAAVGVAIAAVSVGLSGSVPSALGAAVGGALVSVAADLREPTAAAVDVDDSRRTVLAGAAALAVGVVGVGGRRAVDDSGVGTDAASTEPVPEDVATLLDEAESKSLSVDGLEPLVSDSFYRVDVANVDPDPAREDWSMRIHGAVDEETTITVSDIEAMEQEHRFATLRCVGESLNGRKLDNALWTGVPLATFLEEAGLQGEYVMLRAADGFYEEFPVDALEEGFLAVGMNGRPLPRGHGAPARALIPGHWGEINVKWLTEIEILDEPATGYWEERGWHGTGPVETVAKLWAENRLDDGRIEVGGTAYAGTRGIDRVEVSTDAGATWVEAELSEPLPGDDVWRQWVHRYEAGNRHEVVVRAVDGTGTVQPQEEAEAFPSGPSGWVSKTVDPRSL
ncbi:molybdopterin-dependent oxidoreductase [Haloplanus sp.]|uniref:molybdopterin-dependent oxidoreductase n=1 Tax=Haloplanus sp. TaxID=1961696 RepID=UPI0026107099|nr:molybdopterin-dependent oxidoreductase [Haloplanus sp.]